MTSAGDIVPVTAIDDKAGRIIAFGQRVTSKTYTGTEVGVLRLDSVPLVAGRRYIFETSSLEMSTVSGETGKANFRINTAGTATTSSTLLIGATGNANTAFSPTQGPTVRVSYSPGSTGNVSLLLTLLRSGGSGNVTLTGSSTQPIEMYVIDHGPDPGDSGVDI